MKAETRKTQTTARPDMRGYRLPSAVRQVAVLAKKEIRAGFASKTYRIGAVLLAVIIFAAPLLPKIFAGSPGGATVAVVGSARDRDLLLAMNILPPTAKAEELDRLPEDEGKYDLVIDASATPVTLSAGKSSQLAAFPGLAPSVQLFQTHRDGIVAAPPPEIRYGSDDAGKAGAVAVSIMVSVIMLIFMIALAGAVMQGVFADKNNRLVDVLYPKASALRLLAGKILGIGAFGWLQLLIFGGLSIASAGLSTDLDWRGLLLPPAITGMAWFVFGYLFVAFIAAALASVVRSAQALTAAMIPLYVLSFSSYFAAFTAVADLSAPWVWWLGLFPPFSSTFIPLQAASGGLDAGYLLLSALVSAACVLLVAVVGSRVYRRCIVGRPTRP